MSECGPLERMRPAVVREVPSVSELKEEETGVSLPCRGCTADCPDRERCGGLPWRLPRESDQGRSASLP